MQISIFYIIALSAMLLASPGFVHAGEPRQCEAIGGTCGTECERIVRSAVCPGETICCVPNPSD
ncbi:Hypothetical predicted protein [Podarcis lilfordi]|uniref:Beta-defensin n=1 Tax=Podarcis lilfordi TaxID=74358 RepID=A0AA35K6V8_9SAUR|nr:Hypothetical predicted protein [Podarcis lilfordi]